MIPVENTIVQIIPAPPELRAVFAGSDGSVWTERVMCLAIVAPLGADDYPNREVKAEREIRPVPFNWEEGCEDPLSLSDNIIGYSLEPVGCDDAFWRQQARSYLDREERRREQLRQKELARKPQGGVNADH